MEPNVSNFLHICYRFGAPKYSLTYDLDAMAHAESPTLWLFKQVRFSFRKQFTKRSRRYKKLLKPLKKLKTTIKIQFCQCMTFQANKTLWLRSFANCLIKRQLIRQLIRHQGPPHLVIALSKAIS